MAEKTGSCLCGEVKFTADLKTSSVGACHCEMCRQFAAGPFFSIDAGDSFRVTDGADKLGVYKSSQWAERGFCTACGSSLFWRLHDGTMAQASVNAFADLADLKLDHEVYIDAKPDYYSFSEKTHQMTEADVMKMVAEGKGL
ncbi:MAG: GFA family protein [Pseudomonadota bacterium]